MHIEPLPYELRIGVTGHRNLQDPEGVQRAVRGLLERLQAIFESATAEPYGPSGTARGPLRIIDDGFLGLLRVVWESLPSIKRHVPPERRTPLHWVVQSPIAKGADRVVAEAVLERPNSRLEVSTPFPITDYRHDFDTASDSVEFERLLAHDAAPVELPNPYGREEPGDSETVREQKRELRRDGYEQIGRHILKYSEIIIAVWNGRGAAGRGGTGDVVREAVEMGRVVLWIDADDPSRPPQILVKPRKHAPPGPEGEPAWYEARPLPQRARDLSLGFHELSAYNRDHLYDADAALEKFEKRRTWLLESARAASMPLDSVKAIINTLLPHYIRADQLASRYQSIFVASALWIHGLAALAVTIAVCQYLLWHERLWLVWFEVAAMFVALFLQRVNHTQRWRDKWLNDRHLAEQVRLALFSIYIGPIGEAAKGHERVLPFYPGPWPWITAAIVSIAQPIRQAMTSRPPVAALRQWLVQVWLEDQARWHAGNAHRKEAQAHRLHFLGFCAFFTTLVMSCLHALGVGHVAHDTSHDKESGETEIVAQPHAADFPLHNGGDGGSQPHESPSADHGSTNGARNHEGYVARHARALIPDWLWKPVGLAIVILAMALPAWGAAAHAFNTLRDYERIATRSEMMHRILDVISRRAANANTFEALAAEVQDALELMRTENEEWMASFRIGTDPQPV
ncbi:MAG: hypothetical protein ACT4QC_21180 [Planctomycetaceae bacterium]